jgi:hypothetical protein
MGSALFKSLELFFGTNSFAVAAANNGVNPGSGNYTLSSEEFDMNGVAGMTRQYNNFTQAGLPTDLNVGLENSPEGENGMSRIYFGIHWIFDQQDGMMLGRNIAGYLFSNAFQAVPEPTSLALGLLVCAAFAQVRRRA